jgi:hypothetical protein
MLQQQYPCQKTTSYRHYVCCSCNNLLNVCLTLLAAARPAQELVNHVQGTWRQACSNNDSNSSSSTIDSFVRCVLSKYSQLLGLLKNLSTVSKAPGGRPAATTVQRQQQPHILAGQSSLLHNSAYTAFFAQL